MCGRLRDILGIDLIMGGDRMDRTRLRLAS